MITLRPYQQTIMNAVTADFRAGADEVVIAVCPSGGKTKMAIKFIQDHPSSTFLILCHATLVIKDQVWGSELTEQGIRYSDDLGSRVCCTIPQSIFRKEIPPFDYIIIDEAHEFNFADMVMNIKFRVGGKKIYLTGTPSKFVRAGKKIHCIAALQLIKEGYISDVYTSMVTTFNSIEESDHNKDGEIKESSGWKLVESVNNDMDRLLPALISRMTESNHRTIDGELSWKAILSKMNKTLIACHSIDQCNEVLKFLKNKGVKAISSESKSDSDCENIKRFIKEPFKVLVVVNRAILGFNMEELCVVADLTGSRNIDRIYQLFARVMRKHDLYPLKYFFKFSSEHNMKINQLRMDGALQMMKYDFITTFNGRNLNGMKIPVQRDMSTKDKSDGSGTRSGERVKLIDTPFMRQLAAGAFLQAIDNHIGDGIKEYAYSTVGDILRRDGSLIRDPESRKVEIISFIKEKGRRPSCVIKEEICMQRNMASYISEGYCSFDSDFAEQVESLSPSIKTPETRKTEIINFIKEHGRRPSCKTESKLCMLMRSYIYPSKIRKCDEEFKKTIDNLCPEIDYKTKVKLRNQQLKDGVLAFVKQHKRIPSIEENSIINKGLYKFTSPKSKFFDKDFKELVYSLVTNFHDKGRNKQSLLDFIRLNKALPTTKTNNRLYHLYRSYTAPSSKVYDQSFIVQVREILGTT